ncbi:sugar phosphate isomerase/epimerase family protein [Pedococcus sp. 5OH_020]|uniref:sugar phosphate isomerase/epimerase family protein n=1 Tax=Pedococcus sp. 5OH_020 TaxID=2989814 RepID=UPI0022E9FA3A|nr:sugar phosphate isomerase/epimerase [Pedococcus sp. 5OH_020]
MSTPLSDRIAGAPISWGVSEVPGWGHQLDPATVLAQMADLGLAATEFGPDGFLPASAADKVATLRTHGLQAVGQFVPVVLHDPGHDPLPEVDAAMDDLVAAGASTVVLAAATGQEGYDDRPVLDDRGWATLLANLDRLTDAAASRGVVATLHPHVGTMVESGAETERVLAGSRVGLCLDTGHLLIGGGDPVALAKDHPDRIVHTHLKDVRLEWARRVRSGEVTYTEAVAQGMYVPLGDGDVDLTAILTALEDHGYGGWYVLEQDTILDGPPPGAGPVEDVELSLNFLLAFAAQHSGVGI